MDNEKYQGFIRGKIVELRPMKTEHLPIYNKWISDRRNRRLLREDMPSSEEEQRKWFFEDPKKENVHFEIWYIPDNKLVGEGGLHHIHWRNRNAWLGLLIGEIDYWDKGIGSETSELMVRYGFEELNLHKIVAGIFEPNLGSQKCALKMGMKLESKFKEDIYIDGRYYDTYIYSMLDRDWFSLHPVEGR